MKRAADLYPVAVGLAFIKISNRGNQEYWADASFDELYVGFIGMLFGLAKQLGNRHPGSKEAKKEVSLEGNFVQSCTAFFFHLVWMPILMQTIDRLVEEECLEISTSGRYRLTYRLLTVYVLPCCKFVA